MLAVVVASLVHEDTCIKTGIGIKSECGYLLQSVTFPCLCLHECPHAVSHIPQGDTIAFGHHFASLYPLLHLLPK